MDLFRINNMAQENTPGPNPDSFEHRLNELTLLQQGWLDGFRGDVIEPQTITNVRCLLRRLKLENFHSEPAISPAYPDGLTLSWPKFSISFPDCVTGILIAGETAREISIDTSFNEMIMAIADNE